jgi:NAD+ kinase
MKVAIYGQVYQKNSLEPIETLFSVLSDRAFDVHVEEAFFNSVNEEPELKIDLKGCNTFTSLDPSFNLLISVGGDGTILRAVTYIRDLGIPIVGINTGRLGFLATIQENLIEKAINDIAEGRYRISKRSLLSVSFDPEDESLFDFPSALNEIAISRKNTTSMITVETSLNGEYLTSYWADGLIVSTPTGSTGYSLSCGGPVIMPETHSLTITPIAPHNLNARPLVIEDSTEIKLKISGREDSYLVSLDSRIATVDKDTTLIVKKANFKIKMIELHDESFLNTLRKKLLWGEDKRN